MATSVANLHDACSMHIPAGRSITATTAHATSRHVSASSACQAGCMTRAYKSVPDMSSLRLRQQIHLDTCMPLLPDCLRKATGHASSGKECVNDSQVRGLPRLRPVPGVLLGGRGGDAAQGRSRLSCCRGALLPAQPPGLGGALSCIAPHWLKPQPRQQTVTLSQHRRSVRKHTNWNSDGSSKTTWVCRDDTIAAEAPAVTGGARYDLQSVLEHCLIGFRTLSEHTRPICVPWVSCKLLAMTVRLPTASTSLWPCELPLSRGCVHPVLQQQNPTNQQDPTDQRTG